MARSSASTSGASDLSDATDPPNFLTPVTGCDATQVLGPQRSFDIDCSGKPALNAPEWKLNLGIEQTVPLGDYKAVIQGGTRYRGSSYSTADYLPYLQSQATFVSYASLTFAREDDGLFVTLYVNNIEDNQRLVTGTATSAGLISASAEQPRTYGIRVGGQF